MKQRTPKQIQETVARVLGLDLTHLKAMVRPQHWDHKKGYGRASLIAQALSLQLCSDHMTKDEIGKALNRKPSGLKKAWARVNDECREGSKMADEVRRIVKEL